MRSQSRDFVFVYIWNDILTKVVFKIVFID